MAQVRQDASHHRGESMDAGSDLPRSRNADDNGCEGRAGWLSIVVPAKNEAAGLPQLVRELSDAFRPLLARPEHAGHLLRGFEIVLVDDGSTDDTDAVLRRLRTDYPELHPVRLVQNVGQSAAITAGFWAARGEWIGILDADLQNPPSELARLWDALPGHDAALGWRAKRRDVAWKRYLSRAANRIRNLVLREPIKDTGCSVRIFPRKVARRLPMFHGAHRFFGALLIREGCSIVQIPVEHRPRPHGQSHYNFWNRSLKVIEDLFGVAWLMRRPVRYQVQAAPRPSAVPPHHAASALANEPASSSTRQES